MKTSLIVSQRGQITLPAELRKRLGIKEGSVVTMEERGSELVLRPAVVVEVETYSDQEIAQWDQEDELSKVERQRLKHKLLSRR